MDGWVHEGEVLEVLLGRFAERIFVFRGVGGILVGEEGVHHRDICLATDDGRDVGWGDLLSRQAVPVNGGEVRMLLDRIGICQPLGGITLEKTS